MREDFEDRSWIYSRYYHHRGTTWPIILIIIGVIFLLNNFGVLPWSTWSYLWRLWPLFLIVAGIHMLFGRGPIAHFFSSLISLILIILALALALAPTNPQINQYLNQYLPGLQQHINIPQDFHTQGPGRDFNFDDGSNSLY